MNDLIKNSGIQAKYTSTGRRSGFKVDLYHSGLKEHRTLSAVDWNVLQGKIHNLTLSWKKKWEKELQRREQQSQDSIAKDRNEKAQEKLKATEQILLHTLSIDDTIDWESLKHKDEYCSRPSSVGSIDYINFNKNGFPENVSLIQEKPLPKAHSFSSKVSFLKKITGQEAKIKANDRREFQKAVALINTENDKIRKVNENRKAKLETLKIQWKEEQSKFETTQNSHNAKVDQMRSLYERKDISAVLEYCEMVLNNSEYPESFPKEFDLQYNETNGMLLVDYQLPSLKSIPCINNVRYVKSRNEIEEKYLSQTALAKLYDLAIYQIVLRTLHELFEADKINALQAINLNGLVTSVNPATGHEETSCIVSIQAKKEEFEQINLQGIVDHQSYKQCFKSLKGVGSSKLSTLTAVQPILEINKSDKRFRDHYEVASGLNDEVNIAAMNWEDFEHLVREIFEKEFTATGGEVKVTQASADGGVDAVAFDPDPIRGGKIVIQAKRYTNVVGVAAVRDLYGTVLNEGATKGILVTTSDYGSDSYNFAKDKPLTLLNGSNLLHLLEKHGHKAKIDIKEAKKIIKDNLA